MAPNVARHGTSPSGTISVVGTGAIGSAVAKRLLGMHQPVVVWNRTADRAQGLVEAGATPAPSPQDAVTAGTLTLVALKDYPAVHEAFDHLEGDLSGRTIAVLCTGTPADARAAAERVEALGAHYLDAGVQTSPEDIGTDRATILYSGSTAAFEQHRATLELLSTPRFVGSSADAAATWDLTLFGLWYDAQLGLLRALDTVRSSGIDLDEFVETAKIQLGHVVAEAPATATELQTGDFPRGPADLEEHLTVVRQLVELRAGSRLGDGGLSRADEVLDSLIEAGRGGQGLTATVG